MTRPFLEKSFQSMLVARSLLVERQYPSTVNRAYYSCLQFILHILIEKLGHTYEYLETMPRHGTHSQAQYLIEFLLVKRVGYNKADYKWFQEKMPAFKQQRVLADYYADPLNYDTGLGAINDANAIVNTLKTYFK